MSNPAVEDYVLAPVPRPISRRPTGPDAVFTKVVTAIGASVLVITGGIGLFLAFQSIPTLHHYGFSFFTTQVWNPDQDRIGIAAVLVGTLQIALVAMAISFPLALGTALFINEYAPPKFQSTLVAGIDMMAAIPSIVYGLWGFFLIEPHASKFALLLQQTFQPLAVNGFARTVLVAMMLLALATGVVLRWVLKVYRLAAVILLLVASACAVTLLPLLAVVNADPNAAIPDATRYTASAFIAGIAVSMMVLPMACAVMRQVFSQVPQGEREAALGLGATTWGTIRAVVLPFGRGGIIGGTMLSMGRALGETIAVLLIVSPEFVIKLRPLEIGTTSISSLIAGRFGEAHGIQVSALLTAGFVLFVITLIINSLAAVVVSRSRSGAETS